MKIILKKDVQSLGESGDIVEVKDGFARNYLLPASLAELATDGALKNRDKNLARIKAKAEKVHQEAMEVAERIKGLGALTIQVKAGDNGKLFGAITTRRLADEVKSLTDIDVDRRNISLDRPINHVGEYKMVIKLTSKVDAQITIIIVPLEELR